ncbi:MAG: YtxH domain-containing protein [Ignavibacteriae bacterium]|nr:YtxH domain-containing protein [Ignavibacteriota bacterium]
MTSINKTKWYLFSFLAGGAVGSTIALLYAPESGRHLRKDIRRKTNDYIENGKKIVSNTWNDAKETAESALESANDFLNSSMEKIMRKKKKEKNALKSGYDAYNDERKSGNN